MLIYDALVFAQDAHYGQTRRGHGNEPYINHPCRVAEHLREFDLTAEEDVAAALLHDVLEDTERDISQFPKRVRDMVNALTRQKKEKPYESKESAIQKAVAFSPETALIKMVDRYDNLRDANDISVFAQGYLPVYLRLSEELVSLSLETHPRIKDIAEMAELLGARIAQLWDIVKARI